MTEVSREHGPTKGRYVIRKNGEEAEMTYSITSPTLVLHGRADPLVPYAHGEDTAQRIAGARLIGVDGMGHDLPPEPVAQILDALIPHLQAAKP